MTKLTKRKLICVVIILAGLALDFLSKRIIENNMELLESIPLWRDVFHITYVQNRGAAFGMMADNRWVFLSVSTVAIIAFCIYLARTRSDRPVWLYSLAMMTSGGIGNMIGRGKIGLPDGQRDHVLHAAEHIEKLSDARRFDHLHLIGKKFRIVHQLQFPLSSKFAGP